MHAVPVRSESASDREKPRPPPRNHADVVPNPRHPPAGGSTSAELLSPPDATVLQQIRMHPLQPKTRPLFGMRPLPRLHWFGRGPTKANRRILGGEARPRSESSAE